MIELEPHLRHAPVGEVGGHGFPQSRPHHCARGARGDLHPHVQPIRRDLDQLDAACVRHLLGDGRQGKGRDGHRAAEVVADERGSDAWIASYARRTQVEGAFGNLTSDKTTGVKRGWIYVVGIVKTSIMVAAAAVATNIRLLRKWADRTGDRTHPLCSVDPQHHGFEEIDADGNPDLALAPPAAA